MADRGVNCLCPREKEKKSDPPFVCPSPTKIREGQCTKAESRGKCADTPKRILCDGNFRPGQDEECDDGNSETNLLELLNGTLVDTTALVDQVAGLETLSACHDMQQRRWE